MRNGRLIVLVLGLFVVLSIVAPQLSCAQCAMCSLNAENSARGENTQGKGLNNGILFLLAMPFLIGGGVGLLWYKRFRNAETRSSVL
ncbi:MAG TPA: hypothetical protein PKA53_05570 [Sphingobacterium sp.]|nr:hypothetical protein [Sphingobacterium sp.]